MEKQQQETWLEISKRFDEARKKAGGMMDFYTWVSKNYPPPSQPLPPTPELQKMLNEQWPIPEGANDFHYMGFREKRAIAAEFYLAGQASMKKGQEKHNGINQSDAIHHWFELSYAQYLTVPRSVLQSMPSEWQERFVKCLEELDETIDWRPKLGRYWVQLKSIKGHYIHDHLMDYERGRRRIAHRDKQSKHSTNANV